MKITLLQYLIICPLVGLGGFVDAIAGGGGLISLPAYLIAGLPVHNAIGTNKISSCMGTSLTTYRFARKGYIPWKIAIFCVVCALAGSAMGAELALLIEDRVFKMIMLAVIPLTAWYVFRHRTIAPAGEPFGWGRTTLISCGIALVIGVYDGFYGPGTGTFLILLLTGMAHVGLKEANGIAKSINLATNVAAIAVYLTNGKSIVLLGVIAGIFGIAGNYIGSRFFENKGSKAVRPIMLGVLLIFFIRVISELV